MTEECPLCERPIEPGQPNLTTMWQEMESDERVQLFFHESCAWLAIRDKLYALEGDLPAPTREPRESKWIGWEPLDAIFERAYF